MVDFGGWDMPIHYGSQLEEHHVVRRDAGICDVSHMTVIDLCGPDATAYLRYLLANDVARLDMPGKALYSAMLNEAGGVLDDLIVYLDTGADGVAYRIVVNCATREKDLAWMTKQTQGFDCQLTERPELAILAIQGPRSLSRVSAVVEEAHAAVISRLKPFVGAWSGNWFIARTGYTGEKGVEIILPGEDAQQLWQQLVQAGIKPVGLGATYHFSHVRGLKQRDPHQNPDQYVNRDASRHEQWEHERGHEQDGDQRDAANQLYKHSAQSADGG